MSLITSLAGVSIRDAKRAMKDLLLFEGQLALVSENLVVSSTVGSPSLYATPVPSLCHSIFTDRSIFIMSQ